MPGMTVTATQGGTTGGGTILEVLVLNNATIGSSPNAVTGAFAANAPTSVTLTPQGSGSLCYGVALGNPNFGGSFEPGWASQVYGNTTFSGSIFFTWLSSPTTAGGSLTFGSNSLTGSGPAQLAIVEVQQSGGTIAQDASTPAVVNASGTSATTASFTPPAGSLILAIAAGGGTSGTQSVTVTGSVLTFALAATIPQSGDGVISIYYAVMPPPPQIVTTQLPGAAVGSAYSFTLSGVSGTKPYAWSVSSGSLPAGLGLNGSTGVISGTPTGSAGLSTFTVTLTDALTFTASQSYSIVVNADSTPGGVVRATWALSQFQYAYGTLAIPVGTLEHDWVFVSVSWAVGQDQGIAYCTDNVHNYYQAGPVASGTNACTQVFVVPNARAVGTVYVSTSMYARWLSVQVTEVTGLQPGYVVDAVNTWTGSGTSLTESLSTAQADFILAVFALTGTPQTITQSGSGASWTALTGSINGSASAGVTQSLAWAETSGAASPSMQFTGTSGSYSGVMIAVKQAGGLPVNSNPAWPVIKARAAFGYTPNAPTALPSWTDLTSRFWGLNGQRGRSFELDEISAADLTASYDNPDGNLSPQNSASPYYPNVSLITPVEYTATWQGREFSLLSGLFTAIPQTFDFQRGLVNGSVSDMWSRLPTALLAPCMVQEMLYDQPLDLWPLNDSQGAPYASNWSGLSAAQLVPTVAQGGGGTTPSKQLVANLFGQSFSIASSFLTASTGSTTTTGTTTNSTSNTPATGFGNAQSGTYPGGLAGTTDPVWGNTSAGTTTFQGTVLIDSNDSTLPLTVAGATYSVWAQMLGGLNGSTGAVIMALSNQAGTGSAKYLEVYVGVNGTTVTVSQTSGSSTYTAPASLFDGRWHLWTVTITAGGVVTLYLDSVSVLSYTATFPGGSPTLLQFGGDSTIGSTSSAGLWTGSMYLAGVYSRVIDPERIQTWYVSGVTGFLDDLTGARIQRVLAWARWSAPQAIDQGLVRQQAFNYLTGGYASSGLTGAVGNYSTAGASAAIDSGAQADMTLTDIANTECGLLILAANGTLAFHESDDLTTYPNGLPLGDMDYPLNQNYVFKGGLGEWTNTTSCTVAQSSGWSYANTYSGLMTVTGTPSSASVAGGQFAPPSGGAVGFSAWVMSPQGCSVNLGITWSGSGNLDFYQATYTDPYGEAGPVTTSGATVYCPPMTPVFLTVPATAVPSGATGAQGVIVISGSPATGTQLYFDRTRLSPAGFQVPYLNDEPGDLNVTEDIQYLFNDVAVTRNVDQAAYRTISTASRSQYFPRVYTRTIFSSADQPTALVNAGNTLLSAFATPQLRVEQVIVDAAKNPEAWEFVLSTDIGDTVSFTRTPVGGAVITGSFLVISIAPDLAPDKAQFTYVLAPSGVF